MNPPQITLELHRRYIERILQQTDYVEIDDNVILALTAALDSTEQYYHVEGKMVYRIKYWKATSERRELLKLQLEEFKTKVDKRKAALAMLTTKVMDEFGFEDRDVARQIAHGILVKNKIGAAMLLGIDLAEVPKLEGKYMVVEGTYYYEL
jgi:DNA integrity scanning protein DisA with diadenylate cyclase activity